MTQRSEILLDVAKRLLASHSPQQITKVAIDGVDGAGKTVFADELTEVLYQSPIDNCG